MTMVYILEGGDKMSVSNKIKSLMSIKEIRSIELAGFLGMSPQSLRNKFNRGSFSAEDLIKIADILGVTLNFEIDGKQRIVLDINDVREHTENQDN